MNNSIFLAHRSGLQSVSDRYTFRETVSSDSESYNSDSSDVNDLPAFTFTTTDIVTCKSSPIKSSSFLETNKAALDKQEFADCKNQRQDGESSILVDKAWSNHSLPQASEPNVVPETTTITDDRLRLSHSAVHKNMNVTNFTVSRSPDVIDCTASRSPNLIGVTTSRSQNDPHFSISRSPDITGFVKSNASFGASSSSPYKVMEGTPLLTIKSTHKLMYNSPVFKEILRSQTTSETTGKPNTQTTDAHASDITRDMPWNCTNTFAAQNLDRGLSVLSSPQKRFVPDMILQLVLNNKI